MDRVPERGIVMSAAQHSADRQQRMPGPSASMLTSFLFFVACLSCLVFTSCSYPLVDIPSQQPVRPFSGPWEYRFGDSPVQPDGRPIWAQPDSVLPGWQATPRPSGLPGRPGLSDLWLRTRIAASPDAELTLCLPKVTDYYDLYIDGSKHEHPHRSQTKDVRHDDGPQVLFLKVRPSHKTHTLVFRLSSNRKNIGIRGSPIVGGTADVVQFLLIDHQFDLSVGIFIVGIGVIGLTLFFIRRRDYSYIYFSSLCWSLGAYICVSRSESITLFYPRPGFWWEAEVVSLYFIGISAILFYRSIFGKGPMLATTLIAWGYQIVGWILFLLVLLNGWTTADALPYIQVAFLVMFAYLSSYSFAIAIIGNIDARIFGTGFLVAMLPATYQLLTSLGLLPGQISSAPFSGMIIVITNVVVMARRFRYISKKVQDYSAMLQINLANAVKSSAEELAGQALERLCSLLPITAGSIYILRDGSESLDLLAARRQYRGENGMEVDDHATADLGTLSDAGRDLVRLAIEKGRTLGGILPTPQLSNGVESKGKQPPRYVVASLLVAQEEIIGALYAELRPGHESLDNDDMELLNGLSQQIAMSIMTNRAARLAADSAAAQSRLTKQKSLLDAAARLARGDLDTAISTSDPDEFGRIAAALEEMRTDLRRKIATLESNNQEIRELNDELRRQIDQRSRRVLDWALSTDERRTVKKNHFAPGSMLGEYYKVVKLLGQGVMGSVYEVERLTDGKRLAAKVLTARADRNAMIRFVREAQLLARLIHPNLVSIVDIDVNEQKTLYLVMELIHGKTLRQCKGVYVSFVQQMSILYQIASGLSAVHLAGIVHRDLKPANVLVEDISGQDVPLVKLVDFGFSTLSRAQDATDQSKVALTSPFITGEIPIVSANDSAGSSENATVKTQRPGLENAIIGTPIYMAPECRDPVLSAQPAADMFSFGVLAYELLTGVLPFNSPPMAIDAAGLALEYKPVAETRPELPPAVSDLIDRSLNVNPGERPQAIEVADMLSSILRATVRR